MKTSLVIVNKNERGIADTLDALKPFVGNILHEVLVIDASNGVLDDIRQSHEWTKWIDFKQPEGVGITIARQRNVGVRSADGDVIVFTDAGCLPEDGWLERLLAPIFEDDEFVSCGPARSVGKSVYSGDRWWVNANESYV
ncbi:MAG: glycosyltransferase, partial [Acidimicrobiales bacterium]